MFLDGDSRFEIRIYEEFGVMDLEVDLWKWTPGTN